MSLDLKKKKSFINKKNKMKCKKCWEVTYFFVKCSCLWKYSLSQLHLEFYVYSKMGTAILPTICHYIQVR